jgi:hypothetical protein
MGNDTDKKHFSEAFFNFVSDPDGLSAEELRAELINLSIDPDKLENRIKAIVIEGSAERRLSWLRKAKIKREEIEKKFESIRTSGKEMNTDLKNRIKDILEGRHGQAAFTHAEAYFRKGEDLSEQDLASLINDLEILIHLEESEDKDK